MSRTAARIRPAIARGRQRGRQETPAHHQQRRGHPKWKVLSPWGGRRPAPTTTQAIVDEMMIVSAAPGAPEGRTQLCSTTMVAVRGGRSAAIDHASTHQPRAQCVGGHKQGGRTVEARSGELRRATTPREWRVRRVVNRHAGAPRFLVGERGVHRIEQTAGGRLAKVGRIHRQALCRSQIGRDSAERPGGRQELLAQLRLEACDGVLVGRPEPRAPNRPPAEGHRDCGDEAGQNDAPHDV